MKKIKKILLVITLIYFSFIKQINAAQVESKSTNSLVPSLIIALLLASLVTALLIFWLISKNRMEKTNEEAKEYLIKDSIKIVDIEDKFIDSNTIRYKSK